MLEDRTRSRSEIGTVQGGSISPLLANIYLHYVFDTLDPTMASNRGARRVVVVRLRTIVRHDGAERRP